MKFEFGIERKRLVDCYAKKKVADDIEVSSRRHRLDARRKNVMSLTVRTRRGSKEMAIFW